MKYYIGKTVNGEFDAIVTSVVEALKKEGFGVLTEIDVSQTLKQKIGVDFPKYRILGACNPTLAHKALMAEAHVGVMLPCNVIVRDAGQGAIEIAAMDPRAPMQQIGNPALDKIGAEVATRMERVVASL